MRQRIITKLIIKAYQNTEFKYKITFSRGSNKKKSVCNIHVSCIFTNTL